LHYCGESWIHCAILEVIYTPKETLTEANCAYLKYVNPSFSSGNSLFRQL